MVFALPVTRCAALLTLLPGLVITQSNTTSSLANTTLAVNNNTTIDPGNTTTVVSNTTRVASNTTTASLTNTTVSTAAGSNTTTSSTNTTEGGNTTADFETTTSTSTTDPPVSLWPERTSAWPGLPSRPPSSTFRPVCLTESGPAPNYPCSFPFVYRGRVHHHCTRQDWHTQWCAVHTDAEDNFIEGKWGECGPDCAGSGPLKCYYKYALDPGPAQLRYCGPGQDLCLVQRLRHEDGVQHTSQQCSSSQEEDWREGGPHCQYGQEGGYRCVCHYPGCNLDAETAGYFPVRARLMPVLFSLLYTVMLLACCCCCCRCCCPARKQKGRVLQQRPQRSR